MTENLDPGDHQSVPEKLHKCSKLLAKWGRRMTNKFKDKIAQQKQQIEYHRRMTSLEGVFALKAHKEELSKLLEKEETHWRQSGGREQKSICFKVGTGIQDSSTQVQVQGNK